MLVSRYVMLAILKPKPKPSTVLQFQLDYPFEIRRREAESVRSKYPDRVPCVVETRQGERDITLVLDKKKYLVPNDVTMSQFTFVLRKRMHIAPHKALFLLVNNTLISGSSTMNDVYSRHKDESQFLHILISSENAFGA